MALTPYNPSPNERLFRKINFYLTFLGAVFVGIAAPLAHYGIFAIGLVPLLYTFLLGSLIARFDKKDHPISKILVACFDIFGALCYVGSQIPIWVGPNRTAVKFQASNYGWRYNNYYYGETGYQMSSLIAYGSSVFLLQMAIHSSLGLHNLGFFAVLSRVWAVLSGPTHCSRCRDCPSCRAAQAEEGRASERSSQNRVDRGAAYSLLGDVGEDDAPEDNPRASGEA